MNEKTKKLIGNILKPIMTILISLVIGALLIIPTGASPIEAYSVLFEGAFGSVNNFYNTLARSTPLIFTGLAAAFAFKAGVFNIGIEGQLYMGAMAAALTGIYLGGLPTIIVIPACLIAAMIAGMLWAALPGLLKTKLDINIVITCIMMNSIAQLFTDYLATYPFKGELPIGATHKISEAAMLPRMMERSELNLGFILAIILALVLYVVIFKTKFGYESRAFGLNQAFAKYIGIHPVRKMMVVLFISGMIAGLAGAEQVMGVNYRFISNFSNGYGFTGITVALLGRHNPIGVILAALFFGALNNGAIQMEVMTNISRDLIASLQAIMIILLAAEQFVLPRFKRKGGKTE